jgi:hypothetical protein
MSAQDRASHAAARDVGRFDPPVRFASVRLGSPQFEEIA